MSSVQREVSTQNQEQVFVPVLTAGSGVGFSKGVMQVNGRTQRPIASCDFDATNGLTKYTAVVWQDPITGEQRTSCNCPAWCISRGHARTCRHTQALEGHATTAPRQRRSRPAPNPPRVKQLHTVEEALAAIPDISDDGRLLRAIQL